MKTICMINKKYNFCIFNHAKQCMCHTGTTCFECVTFMKTVQARTLPVLSLTSSLSGGGGGDSSNLRYPPAVLASGPRAPLNHPPSRQRGGREKKKILRYDGPKRRRKRKSAGVHIKGAELQGRIEPDGSDWPLNEAACQHNTCEYAFVTYAAPDTPPSPPPPQPTHTHPSFVSLNCLKV